MSQEARRAVPDDLGWLRGGDRLYGGGQPGVFGWKSLAGLALFGCGGIIYAVLLRRVPLNIAQVFAAAQFIGVVIAATLVLGEPISPARWLGIACISLGIALVGLTAHA